MCIRDRTATDESGVVTTLSVSIKDPNANDDASLETNDDDSGDSESTGLPGVSFMATLVVTLLGAAFASRKKE